MGIQQLHKPSALKDWAYEIIKNDILNLRIPSGAQLHIEDLAAKMEISRTPVREALLRLESEGLVRAMPRVGFFVTEITRRDLEELFEIRELLEGHAAAKATHLLTDEDLAYLEHVLDLGIRAFEEDGDLHKFLETEITFHTFLIEHSQNSRLIAMMESLRDLTYRERILSLDSRENVRQSCEEHKKILGALQQRDSKLVGRLMKEHIRNVRNRLLQFLDLP